MQNRSKLLQEIIMQTITLQVPDNIYLRLQAAAQATKQPFDEIFLQAIRIGSPPDWEDVPSEFQADIAALDRLDDKALWRAARQKHTEAEMKIYQELLDKNSDGTISEADALLLFTSTAMG